MFSIDKSFVSSDNLFDLKNRSYFKERVTISNLTAIVKSIPSPTFFSPSLESEAIKKKKESFSQCIFLYAFSILFPHFEFLRID